MYCDRFRVWVWLVYRRGRKEETIHQSSLQLAYVVISLFVLHLRDRRAFDPWNAFERRKQKPRWTPIHHLGVGIGAQQPHVEGKKRVGFVARFGSVSDSGNHEAAFLVHSPHHLFLILESKHIDPPMSWQHGIHTWRPSDPRARPIGGDPDALMLWLLYCIGSVVNYFLVCTHLCVSCLEKASSM